MSKRNLSILIDSILVKLTALEIENDIDEYYVVLSVTDSMLSFDEQLIRIRIALQKIRDTNFFSQLRHFKEARNTFLRFYLSDAANQKAILEDAIKEDSAAVSIVQQEPLNGSKVALMAYLTTNTECRKIDDHFYQISYLGYDEFWVTQNTAEGGNSQEQTEKIFWSYVDRLKQQNCTLKDNCLRTWLYINDIDNNYEGVVNGRNKVFDEEGLTADTHYIASTGINGRYESHNVLCLFDALAIRGIREEQIHYLYAPEYLNRTSEYGVRFERGTYVDFDNARKVYISGTASIDNRGKVMFKNDIVKQTYRMWENIGALLKEAGCVFEDIVEMTVYLRDMADYAIVDRLFKEKFPETPYIILRASVCRPEWLIESECIAYHHF